MIRTLTAFYAVALWSILELSIVGDPIDSKNVLTGIGFEL